MTSNDGVTSDVVCILTQVPCSRGRMRVATVFGIPIFVHWSFSALVAAFAAASISRSEPVVTAVAAVRAGIVMFAIPFVFAFYPELLLIEAARLDPAGSETRHLPGYGPDLAWGSVGWLCLRLVLALYLLASALARFDRTALSPVASVARLACAALVMATAPELYWPAIAAGFVLCAVHRLRTAPAG